MSKMSFPTANCLVAACFAVLVTLGHAQKSKDSGKSDADFWFEEGLAAWEKAVELDAAIREREAEEAGDEEDEEGTTRRKPRRVRSGDDKPLEQPDFAGAFALIKRAGESGHAKAALKVSELLLAGSGVPKDTIGAFEWAVKAADLGDVEAQLLAASKYEVGRGTTRSLSKALALYERALEQGSAPARMKVAGLLDRGEPGIEQNRPRALPLFQEAAAEGDPEAIFMIGTYLQRGYVVTKDEEAASRWFLRAAEIGEAKAQRKLAMRYFRGTGVEQNEVEALKWCELALQNPDGDIETKNLAREYKEAMSEQMTERKRSQAMRYVERFKMKEFKDIILPPMPYKGPAPVYHMLTDTSGNKLEAAVIAVRDDTVVLERRSDGSRFNVPLKRLSEESRKLLDDLGSK